MTRHVWVLLHRYVGLAMTVFLIVVGLTGSLLAFYGELDDIVNPQFHVAETDLPRLAASALLERAEQLEPRAKAESLRADSNGGGAHVRMSPRVDPVSGRPYSLDFNQIVLHPHTGEELGRRTWGAISEGMVNLMPFIYKLHYNLALDEWGIWVLGIVALAWTLDCFVAFYLTLPVRRRKRREADAKLSICSYRAQPKENVAMPSPVNGNNEATFWTRWKPAWKIKWRGSGYRINFDLHRAGGLWLWGALLVFAWSSVYMNLWDTVYTWATRAVFDYKAPWTELADLDEPLDIPRLDWREAESIGAKLMERAAQQHGFKVGHLVSLNLDRAKGVYVYGVRSSRDIQDRYGHTRVFFDANTGEQKLLLLPTGQYSGNTVTSWLKALHEANVFGLPYRIFVSVLGLAIVMLSVTGVVIWLKKRRARRFRRGEKKLTVQFDVNNLPKKRMPSAR